MKSEPEILAELMNKIVVLDSKGNIFYIGTFAGVDDLYYTLTDVDVHDHSESTSSRELYIIESRQYGVRKNRNRAFVRKTDIISISLLSDVTEY